MRIWKLLLLLAVSVFLLSACQTSVGVSYMVPSEIDMGNYRNLAIASTVPYSGFLRPSSYIRTVDGSSRRAYARVRSSYGWELKDYVASYATGRIYDTLEKSGYYNLTPPEVTDKLLDMSSLGFSSRKALKEYGVDAVLIPRIDDMVINEYIYSRTRTEKRTDKDGKEYEVERTYYYYDADYYLQMSYTIVDAESEKIVAVRRFVVEDSDNFQLHSRYLERYPRYAFERMVDSTMSRITRQLVPLRTTASITLMKNDPKSEGAKAAYSAADDGNLTLAASTFLNVYEAEKHIPSGYNAALLTAASGDIEGALEISGRVYSETGNADVYSLYQRLHAMKQSNDESMKQITGESGEDEIPYSEGMSIYDALRR